MKLGKLTRKRQRANAPADLNAQALCEVLEKLYKEKGSRNLWRIISRAIFWVITHLPTVVGTNESHGIIAIPIRNNVTEKTQPEPTIMSEFASLNENLAKVTPNMAVHQ
eukprot:5593756-Pyramimonas_sp.AAC.1